MESGIKPIEIDTYPIINYKDRFSGNLFIFLSKSIEKVTYIYNKAL